MKRITAAQARRMNAAQTIEALRAAGMILPPLKPLVFYVRKALRAWNG